MNATIPIIFIYEKANVNSTQQLTQINDDQLCINPFMTTSKGVWFGDHPFEYTTPLLMFNIFLISIVTRALHFILKPLGQQLIVSQILGGILLGPSFLGKALVRNFVFPRSLLLVFEIFYKFGLMIFVFLFGVKLDASIILKAGKKVIAMSALCYGLPYVVGISLVNHLGKTMGLDPNFAATLAILTEVNSFSSFTVISCFLSELQILNSELGRLALSSSIIIMIIDFLTAVCGYVISTANKMSVGHPIWSSATSFVFVILSMYFMRRLALIVIKHTPEGKPVKESYLFGIIVLLLGFGLISQLFGISYFILPFYLGLVIPDGPPLGSCLQERLEFCISVILLPIFFVTCGLKTDLSSLPDTTTAWILLLIIIVLFLTKSVGIILPALYFRMPFKDAISLALIMNSKGLVELACFNDMFHSGEITGEVFSIITTSILVIVGVSSPLVRSLYNPSRSYLTYKKRTILHTRTDTGISILTCVHTQDNVPPIIKLLEASNPTKQSPINICVLHLVELVGRDSSLLIHHRRNTRSSAKSSTSEYIIKAFRHYENDNQGIVSVDAFTSIAPFITIHNDVCWLALEERTSFIIIPFHRQWLATGMVESSTAIRNLNSNVIDKAPCSVGILIDHTHLITSTSNIQSTLLYRVGVLFVGGADDQEVLAYALRMVEQPSISLTVIRVSSKDSSSDNERARMLDNNMLDDFKISTLDNDRVQYQEKEVSDGAGFVSTIRSMENSYDLVMVGRRHEESPLTIGLNEWSEYPELGVIGDIMAAPDFKGVASVLVVQQQARVRGTPADD